MDSYEWNRVFSNNCGKIRQASIDFPAQICSCLPIGRNQAATSVVGQM